MMMQTAYLRWIAAPLSAPHTDTTSQLNILY